MAEMSVIPVPGKPGHLFVPSTGKTVIQTEIREDDFFDSVEFASGSQSAGTSQDVFKDQSSKKSVDTNLTTTRRIPANNRFMMSRVGVHVRQINGNTQVLGADILKAYECLSMDFKLNQRLVTEGPLLKYQSGYGVIGSFNNSGTLGVASQAAAPRLKQAQPVSDEDDLNVIIESKARSWLAVAGDQTPTFAGNVVVSVYARGDIEKPLGT